MILNRIGVGSAGKILGCSFAPFGMIYGLFFALMMLLEPDNNLGSHIIFGLLAMIILPIAFVLVGMIIGLVTATCYNFAASITGGIEFEFIQILNTTDKMTE